MAKNLIDNVSDTSNSGNNKFGLFLTIVGLSFIVSIIILFYQLINNSILLNENWTFLTSKGGPMYHPLILPLIFGETISLLAYIIFTTIILKYFKNKSKVVPKLVITLIVVQVILSIIDCIVTYSIPTLRITFISPEINMWGITGFSILTPTWRIIKAIILLPYFVFSKGVKSTFVN